MFTPTILHKSKYIFILLIILILLIIKTVRATEVLDIRIDPPSPIYNQPFKCTLTLDQDDHRNACDLIPLNAPAGIFPWDICRIDHVSNDKLTRFYNCIANVDRKVPGPGKYQIVVWNFTGDGETGQITAVQDITILDQPPPTPTAIPKPTPTPYIPPPTQIIPTQILPTKIPLQNNLFPPPTVLPTAVKRPSPDLNSLLEIFNRWQQNIGNRLIKITAETKRSVFNHLVGLIQNFMKEANY